jgi:Cof subfamily protein (haloacid dehalogenase superfamily)
MKFNALCSDIDGTLLDSHRALSIRTIAAIHRLPASVPVILASSRMPAAMRHLQVELGRPHAPLICFNGGYVLWERNGAEAPEVWTSIHIPLSICQHIVALAKNTPLHVSLFESDHWYAAGEDSWTLREAGITKAHPTFKALDSVLKDWGKKNLGGHKIMCMGPEADIETMYHTLIETFPDELHVYRSKSTYLELAPKSISKATGLTLVMNKLNIDMQTVIAFGDNYNDVEMLHAVGWGVAVANARDEVKAVAREIAPHHKADGVAVTVEKYF